GLFHRFELMRHWYEDDHLPFATFVSADGLHMNDWSYACLAKALALAIGEAATRPAAIGMQVGREGGGSLLLTAAICSLRKSQRRQSLDRHPRPCAGHPRLLARIKW